MSTLGPRTALKSRKISGSLAYILAQTNVKQGTKAATNDVAGCTLEMGADGKWVGTLGSLSKATADALYASGALANLATGATYRDTSGTQYTYDGEGVGWSPLGEYGIRSIARSKNKPVRILLYGDSIANGAGAGGRSKSWLFLVKDSYTSKNRYFQSSAGFVAAGDTGEWDIGSGWNITLGILNYSTITPSTFTATQLCSSFDVIFAAGPDRGLFTIDATGADTITVDSSSYVDGIYKRRISCAACKIGNVLSVARVSGSVIIIGCDPVNENRDEVSFCLVGRPGTTLVNDWNNDGAYASIYIAKALSPHISIVALGRNDARNGVSASAYQSALDTMVAGLSSMSTVFVGFAPPPAPSETLCIEMDPIFISAAKTVAKKYGAIYLDFYKVFGDAYKEEWMCDTIHPNELGQAAMATYFESILGGL